MIPFTFSYARPADIKEAVNLWEACHNQGKTPVYYAGGTEIITLCREMKLKPDLVIDIKSIKECLEFRQDSAIIYGAALPLNTLVNRTQSGLIADTLSKIADHTIRNRLTLGGNIMGRLPYKEAVLPFLLLEGKALAAGPGGSRQIDLATDFNKRIRLENGELITGFTIDPEKVKERYFFIRKQKDSPVDYPVLTACFSGRPGHAAMAVSGAFSSPLRDKNADVLLNRTDLDPKERAQKITTGWASLFKSDFRASAPYRQHLMKSAIENALEKLEK